MTNQEQKQQRSSFTIANYNMSTSLHTYRTIAQRAVKDGAHREVTETATESLQAIERIESELNALTDKLSLCVYLEKGTK